MPPSPGVPTAGNSGVTPGGTGEIPANLRTQDIRIVSPAEGTVVAPGQHIKVVVNVNNPGAYKGIDVIGEFGMTPLRASPPYEFDIVVPNNMLGRKQITAAGFTEPEHGVFSDPVTIDIELPAAAASTAQLSVNMPRMAFQHIGESLPIGVSVGTADGNSAWSPNTVTYRSTDEKVAVVDSGGIVTATGPGQASVVASYGGKTANVDVSVVSVPRGVLKGYGTVDKDDLNILFAGMGLMIPDLAKFCDPNRPANCVPKLPHDIRVPAAKPVDARDLNGDGFLDYQDAEELVRLCAHPNCDYK
jgi:hypothetical protein